MKYTETLHADALLKLLSMSTPCDYCPSAIKKTSGNMACIICREFIGLKHKSPFGYHCPCTELGKQEAIKRTWIALEEKGYI